MYNENIITNEEHVKWFESLRNSEVTQLKVLLYLETPIGVVNFNKINHFDNTCYWGFYIGESNAPKGSGTMLGYLALSYIFENQNIRKVCSEIIAYNTQSVIFHQRMGFLEEGRLIEQVNKENELIDVILMAKFKHHWDHFKVELEEQIRRHH